jgi:hypothetical protein
VCHDRLFKDYEYRLYAQVNQTLHVRILYVSRRARGQKKYSVWRRSPSQESLYNSILESVIQHVI